MEKKKLFANSSIVSIVAFLALIIGAISRNGNDFIITRGEYEPYSIVLETNKNKIGEGTFSPTITHSGNGFATTELGNPVAFEYDSVYNPTNYWQTIKAGGYITNTQPIMGMSSISLTKSSVDASLGVYWSNTTTFTSERYVLFDTSSPLNVTSDFGGYMPNYLKIMAIADSSIENGKIEFCCSNNYPILSLVNESPSLGTVSGAGTYSIGEEITIVATSNTGNYFVGWFTGETSISSSASYTFTMPAYDVTLHAFFDSFSDIGSVEEGSTVQFGTYPQSKVIDDVLISSLNTSAGALPSSSDSQSWTDYGYYISGYVSSYMWYIDLVNEEDEYRGVYFTSYRPSSTIKPSSYLDSYQDDNSYYISNVYWFKHEPITWKVLNVLSDKAFLMADLVLDSQDYHYSDDDRTVGGSTVYSNNYEHSHIRLWLNDNFYNTAFNIEEKARIRTIIVNNSAATSGYSTNPYACANTSDNVFLLSYIEASKYPVLTANASRQLAPSAYAISQGILTYTVDFNRWWLRSPYNSFDYIVRLVDTDGGFSMGGGVYNISLGVVPALWISL